MLALNSNPLVYRQAKMIFRPFSMMAGLMLIAGMLGLVLMYIVLQQNLKDRPIDWPWTWQAFGYVVLVIQILAAFYGSMAVSMGSVPAEKSRKTYEFLVTLPISPADKVAGLTLGHNLHLLAVVAVLTPVGFLASVAGGADPVRLAWLYVMIYTGFLAASLIGVAISSRLGGGLLAWVIVIGLIVFGLIETVDMRGFWETPYLAAAPFKCMVASLSEQRYLGGVFLAGGCHFYGWTVPWQAAPITFHIFLAIVAFGVAARQMSRPSQPPLPRAWTLLAAIAFQAIFVGFLSDSMARIPPAILSYFDHQRMAAEAFLIAYFNVLLLWALFAQPNNATLMEWAGRRPAPGLRLFTEGFSTIRSPNLVPLAALWIIHVGAVWAIDILYWKSQLSAGWMLGLSGALLAYIVAYYLMFLVAAISFRRGEKLVGVGIAVLCFGVPAAFATLPEMRQLLYATPIGILDIPLAARETQTDNMVALSLFYAGLWIAVFGAICALQLARLARKSPGRRIVAEMANGPALPENPSSIK
jgi:hypothetical protein